MSRRILAIAAVALTSAVSPSAFAEPTIYPGGFGKKYDQTTLKAWADAAFQTCKHCPESDCITEEGDWANVADWAQRLWDCQLSGKDSQGNDTASHCLAITEMGADSTYKFETRCQGGVGKKASQLHGGSAGPGGDPEMFVSPLVSLPIAATGRRLPIGSPWPLPQSGPASARAGRWPVIARSAATSSSPKSK